MNNPSDNHLLHANIFAAGLDMAFGTPTIVEDIHPWGFGSRKGKKPQKKVVINNSNDNHLLHAKIFAAAIECQIPALRGLAAQKFAAAVNANPRHSSFAQTILIVYTTTSEDVRDLRDVVASTLTTQTQLLENKDVENVVRSINGLAYELLRKSKGLPAVVGGQESVEETSLCPSCCNPVFSDYCYNCGSSEV